MSGRNRSVDRISKEKMPPDGRSDISKEETGRAGGEEKARRRKGAPGAGRLWAALWMLLCAMLLLRIWGLNQRIEALKDKMDRLARIAVEQQDRLEELADALAARRQDALGREQGGTRGDGTPQKAPDADAAEADAAAVNAQGLTGDRMDDRDSQRSGRIDGMADAGEPEAAHKVYLTFDDGPSAYTEEILDILDKYGVKATFFVVGREGSQAQETMRKIVEAGHTLGMHSYTHDYDQVYESVESFAADLRREQEYLYEVTGVESDLYRFPGGSSNAVSRIDMSVFAQYLDSQGIRFFDWNVSSGDGGSFLVPVDTLIDNCTSTIGSHSTSVVLMHDAAGKTTTREALPRIIETIQAMEDTVLLPITEDTALVQHIQWQGEGAEASGSAR